MNRVIKFRGKRLDNGAWETGCVVVLRQGLRGEEWFIADKMTGYHTLVSRNTVGQFTGLKDENGKEIYEGDILQVLGNKITLTVVFDKAAFKFAWNDLSGEFFPAEWVSNCTIIGNIYDNPELLKRGNYGTEDNH